MTVSKSASITNVKETDVLCGRGGLSNNHQGNRMFRRIVQENKQVYLITENPSRKQLLVLSIIRAIEHHGGRFLRKKGKSWVEITHKEICLKTSQALREQDSNEKTDIALLSAASKRNSKQGEQKGSSKCKKTETPARKMTRKVSDASIKDLLNKSDQMTSAVCNEITEDTSMPVLVEEDLDLSCGTAEVLVDLLSSDDAAFENDWDFCPLELDDFMFSSTTEYTHLCEGLVNTLMDS